MGISLISISHRVAPLAIRELFAFPEEQQRELMRQAVERGIATECIMISTCNRTEIYTYSDREESNFTRVQELLLEFADAADVENIGDYIRLYSDTGAVAHLFRVAAGLDSMVMGEDQILGQVKRAHDQARKTGTCGVYLNTLFRFAVTAAKKVKTESGFPGLQLLQPRWRSKLRSRGWARFTEKMSCLSALPGRSEARC